MTPNDGSTNIKNKFSDPHLKNHRPGLQIQTPFQACDLNSLRLFCKDAVNEALQEHNNHKYSLFDGGNFENSRGRANTTNICNTSISKIDTNRKSSECRCRCKSKDSICQKNKSKSARSKSSICQKNKGNKGKRGSSKNTSKNRDKNRNSKLKKAKSGDTDDEKNKKLNKSQGGETDDEWDENNKRNKKDNELDEKNKRNKGNEMDERFRNKNGNEMDERFRNKNGNEMDERFRNKNGNEMDERFRDKNGNVLFDENNKSQLKNNSKNGRNSKMGETNKNKKGCKSGKPAPRVSPYLLSKEKKLINNLRKAYGCGRCCNVMCVEFELKDFINGHKQCLVPYHQSCNDYVKCTGNSYCCCNCI